MVALAAVAALDSLVAARAIWLMFSAIWRVASTDALADTASWSLTEIIFWAWVASEDIRPRRLEDSELKTATATPETTAWLIASTRAVSMIGVAMAS